jgi:Polyketide cyclase / dehydrase and lipid transport
MHRSCRVPLRPPRRKTPGKWPRNAQSASFFTHSLGRRARFSCTQTLGLLPADLAARILDLANWTDFQGYAVLPGIRAAAYQVRTPGVVGSRIRVTNTDGSSHVEEIMEWQPDRSLRLQMKEFSPPLSRWATEFVESWEFQRIDHSTRVTRSFELHPKSDFARPVLWLISLLLKRAIARHLRDMRDLGQPKPSNHSA